MSLLGSPHRLLAAAALVVSWSAALAQPLSVDLYVGIAPPGGLADQKDLHQDIVTSYTQRGIPVPTQRLFSEGYVVGGDVALDVSPAFQVGLGLQGMTTSAYSRYGDYAGTLDVESHVRAAFLETHASYAWITFRSLSVRLGARAGLVRVWSSFDQAIVLDYPALELADATSARFEASGTGYTFTPFADLSFAFTNRLAGFLQAGQRWSLVREVHTTSTIDGTWLEEDDGTWRHDLGGFVGVLGTRVKL